MVGGRIRKPTARVLDSVESRQLMSSISHERRRAVGQHASTSNAATSAAANRSAPVKRKGKAQNARGKQAVAKDRGLATATTTAAAGLHNPLALAHTPDEPEEDEEEEQEQDMTLYCVCLGYDTGEQPMIQCEHCSNWFHFSCVGLTEGTASQIEAYSCDMCEQMGMGSTRRIGDIPTHIAPSATFYDAGDAYHQPGAGEQDDEDEDEEEQDPLEAQDEDDSDFEGDDSAASKKRKRPAAAGRARSRRKVESDDESEEDDDYDEEEEDRPKRSRAKRPSASGARRASASQQQDAVAGTSVPASDKTRTHVRKQLTSIFSSIFTAAADAAGGKATSDGIDIRSAAFAEEVESELFEAHAEPDDKGVRGPRTKYASKFRSLHFNLKSNAYLRSRVANNELSANKLINLSAEDLQTPELRAMAESVRAASLRNSVKEVLAAPTAKRTHKGEEEIDNEATRIIAAEQVERVKEAQAEEARLKRGEEAAAGSPNNSDSPMMTPAFPNSMDDSPLPQSPAAATAAGREGYSDSPAATPRAYEAISPRDSAAAAGSPAASTSAAIAEGSAASPRADQGDSAMSPPPAPPKPRHSASSNFDMSSIWGKVKSDSKSESPAPVTVGEANPAQGGDADANAADDAAGDEPDLFAVASGGEDDDFEDDLFRDPGASPKKPKSAAPPKPTKPAVSELPHVWAGDLMVPEEGGFPSFGVQVGGRPLGAAPETWKQLLPRSLSTAGRLPTAKAVKYLVECSLAPTRELVITALLPDTTGPSPEFPHKPVKDSCLAKHRHIYDTYLKRDRVGVVQPGREFARIVKDIYIVPLPKEAPLPEYVELADEHVLPEEGRRDEDLLLCILVVQKGVMQTVRPAPQTGSSANDASAVPASAPVSLPPATVPPTVPYGTAATAAVPPPASHYPPSFPSHSPPYGGSPPYAGSHSPLAHQPPAAAYAGATGPASYAPSLTAPAPSGPAGFDTAAMQSLLSQVDPATIDTLLANPALLNSIPGVGAAASATPHAGSAPALPTGPAAMQGYPTGPAAMQGYPTGPAAMQYPHGGGGGGYPQHAPGGYSQGPQHTSPPHYGAGGPPVHPSRQGMLDGAGSGVGGGGGPPVHPSRLAMMDPAAAAPPARYGSNQGWGGQPPPAGPRQGGYGRY
ncbi:hypothetical protein JCM10908_005985 [Rhodotorula pacifica]|uniref:uncharacterized protein n=1 Tax=Rhodotorula pacifica TaxID=1495444 RepID=UPI0031714DD5